MPPADAKLAKALMLGISTLSTTNRFSSGLPPRTMMSLRKSLVPIDDARQALDVARHVLQGRRALEDLARLHQKARVLHRLGRLERRRGHRDRLLEVLRRGQRDLHGAVQPGADVHLVAGEGQAFEGQNLQPIPSRAQLADAKHAAGVAGGARGGVEGAHAHPLCRLAGRVHHDAPDGAHAGGVLRGRRAWRRVPARRRPVQTNARKEAKTTTDVMGVTRCVRRGGRVPAGRCCSREGSVPAGWMIEA